MLKFLLFVHTICADRRRYERALAPLSIGRPAGRWSALAASLLHCESAEGPEAVRSLGLGDTVGALSSNKWRRRQQLDCGRSADIGSGSGGGDIGSAATAQ